jgi:hypothetical protein
MEGSQLQVPGHQGRAGKGGAPVDCHRAASTNASIAVAIKTQAWINVLIDIYQNVQNAEPPVEWYLVRFLIRNFIYIGVITHAGY